MSYRWDPTETLRIFIGYDEREDAAFRVLAHSIWARTTVPTAIIPLNRKHLEQVGLHHRARGPLDSTDFSITRFLVPKLCSYHGHAVFMDCDMLCRVDVGQLWAHIIGNDAAVLVCQHDYTPKSATKFLGHTQTAYPRKNWSSLMVFDNTQCKALTPAYVDAASGLELHRFHWLDEKLPGSPRTPGTVGSLPLEWNWLVGEYPANPDAKILHYTNGGPWFPEYRDIDHADEWFRERDAMLGLVPA